MDGEQTSMDPIPRGSLGEEKMMGFVFSHKPGFELIQNCDLPPPVKVFPGPDKTVLSPMKPVYSMIRQEYEDTDIEMSRNSSENDKFELLKALRLSQTRATKAEKKLDLLSKERDVLLDFLLTESLELYAYKHWLKMMDFQVSKLENQHKEQFNSAAPESGKEDDEVGSTIGWFMAIALCLGIAGFGYAFGCGYTT